MKYGLCYKCKTPYNILGLDANHCPKCGWVDDLIWKQQQVEASEQKAQKKKRSAAKGEEVAA